MRYWDGAGWTDDKHPAGPGAVSGAAARPRTNGMAIAAFVCSLVWLVGTGSILGIVFGVMAQRQIDESGGQEGGRGLATARVVLGLIGCVPALFAFLAIVA